MKITTFTFLFLFLFSTLKAQCPEIETLALYNQSQIDQFIVNYPNCENLNSHLYVSNEGGGVINNLEGLQNLKSVSGFIHLEMGNSSNQNIDGLRNLEYVGSYFIIKKNSITSINNIFTKLNTINGRLLKIHT